MRTWDVFGVLGLATGLATALVTSAAMATKAADKDDSAGATEIEQLRARIAVLEAQCPDPAAQQPPPAGGVAGGTLKYLLKARWDRLEEGMEKDEVRVLLGWPNTVTRSAVGQVEIWGYGHSQTNRYGVGTVYFDDDEEVTTWMSPTFKTN